MIKVTQVVPSVFSSAYKTVEERVLIEGQLFVLTYMEPGYCMLETEDWRINGKLYETKTSLYLEKDKKGWGLEKIYPTTFGHFTDSARRYIRRVVEAWAKGYLTESEQVDKFIEAKTRKLLAVLLTHSRRLEELNEELTSLNHSYNETISKLREIEFCGDCGAHFETGLSVRCPICTRE